MAAAGFSDGAMPLRTAPLNTMLKHKDITMGRLGNFRNSGMFHHLNLPAHVWTKVDAPMEIACWAAPGLSRPTFADAVRNDFKPIDMSYRFGPTWSTHWVRLVLHIEQKHLPCSLMFDPDGEAMVWSQDGEPLQGITGTNDGTRHVDFPITKTGKLVLYLEVACNGGLNGVNGIDPPNPNNYYSFRLCELQRRNEGAQQLLWMFQMFHDMVNEFPFESQIACDALYTANSIVNKFRADRVDESVKEGLEVATAFFKRRALPEGSGFDHKVTAVGNCHIDTAWLWPYDETKRKIARSWSTQCSYIERFPHYTFTASQAQQFEWLRLLYPKLYDRVQKHVKTGNFIPIGGTWVEMDCNMPSGEAMSRQFLYGQRLFGEYFNIRCSTFWLPDTFGYSAQLPQIVSQVGIKNFFTQKLSWNNVNKFPHTSFVWKGLDESTVVSHFSPADTYTAQASVRDIVFMVKNNKDKLYTNTSLLLYGNGDGGGGPLEHMIDRLDKMENIQGFNTQVKHGNPNEFYETLHEKKDLLPVWKGELYLELHRGTYTSHGAVKKGNRKSELLLRNMEIACALNFVKKVPSFSNPKEEIDRMWKLALLNQFHDCLPGSSIEIVYDDVLAFYKDIGKSAFHILSSAVISAVSGDSKNLGSFPVYFNALGWKRCELVELTKEQLLSAMSNEKFSLSSLPNYIQKTKKSINGFVPHDYHAVNIDKTGYEIKDGDQDTYLARVCVDPFSIQDGIPIHSVGSLSVKKIESSGNIQIENDFIDATLDKYGRLASLIEKSTGNEMIKPGYAANNFKLFDDQPLFWDAWDVEIYHMEKGWDLTNMGTAEVVENGSLRVVVQVKHEIPTSAGSWIKQRIILETGSRVLKFETEVEWKEDRKCLKVEFPTSLTSDFATYEIQFGNVRRPTHYNNSWDMARFEVCGHKYADLSEANCGLSLLTESKYGYSVHDSLMRLTLLRAPKAPDAHCDMGRHYFSYALYPHSGAFGIDTVREAYSFNVPFIANSVEKKSISSQSSLLQARPLAQIINNSTLLLDTIKISEEGHAIVLRFYEPIGGRGTARVCTSFPIAELVRTNILEDKVGTDSNIFPSSITPTKSEFTNLSSSKQGGKDHADMLANKGECVFDVPFKPYEIVTLMISF